MSLSVVTHLNIKKIIIIKIQLILKNNLPTCIKIEVLIETNILDFLGDKTQLHYKSNLNPFINVFVEFILKEVFKLEYE